MTPIYCCAALQNIFVPSLARQLDYMYHQSLFFIDYYLLLYMYCFTKHYFLLFVCEVRAQARNESPPTERGSHENSLARIPSQLVYGMIHDVSHCYILAFEWGHRKI